MGEEQGIVALRVAQAWREAAQERHPYETGVDTESQWMSKSVSQEAGTEGYKEPITKTEPGSFGKHGRQV